MLKKKGQVTIFIILGIILLIAIALVIIFREEITIFRPERVIPPEVASLVTYSDNCVEKVAKDSLNLLGAQGGYIYLPNEIKNNPLAYIDAGLKIPLWQYISENRIPSTALMEAHLNQYVEENLNDCLEDFKPFQIEYDFVEEGELEVETTIGRENVVFKVSYPLKVLNKEGTEITEIDEFQAIVPIKLKKVYDVARKIMEKEAEEMKLEKITIDLIALDPEIPLSGFEIGCKQKTWQVNEVEEKLKTLLRTNLPTIRVDKTDYRPVPSDQPYVKNHYIWKVTDLNYPEIKATVQFNENNPWVMAVSPRAGNLLKSGMQQGQELASFICMQMWKFTYSVQYPVLVTVEDEENNYAFNFAFNVQVKKNRASRDSLGAATETFVQHGATSEAYCAEENLYGDYDMKIFTYDNVSDPIYGESHFPINKVNILFTCIKFTCEMGQTEYKQGGAAVLEKQFPYCAGAIIRGKKDGFKEAEKYITTVPGQEIKLYLTPVKTFDKYSVVKHKLVNGVLQGAKNLESGESAFITIKYIDNQTILHSTYGAYPAVSGGELQPIELLAEADFPYEVGVYLMDDEDVIGGYQGNWLAGWTELKKAGEIEFHVVGVGKSESMALLNNIQTYSNQLSVSVR